MLPQEKVSVREGIEMDKLISLTIDTGAFLVRDTGDAVDAASKYSGLLSGIGHLTGSMFNWVDVCTVGEFSDHHINRIREKIHCTFDRPEVHKFDAKTIFDNVIIFLGNLPQFDLHHDILVEASDISVDSDITKFSIDRNHKNSTENCFISVSVLQEIRKDDASKHIVMINSTPRSSTAVEFEVSEVFSNTHDTSNISLPCKIESDVRICDSICGLMSHVDGISEVEILINATNVEDIELAVRVALFKKDPKARSIQDWNDIHVPAIGNSFPGECNKILSSAGSGVCSTLLHAIVEIACDNDNSSYEIRKSRGGNSKRRSFNGYNAMRRKIGSYRLHFWKGSREEIEIAWLCKKEKEGKTPYIPNPTILK